MTKIVKAKTTTGKTKGKLIAAAGTVRLKAAGCRERKKEQEKELARTTG